MNAGNTNSREKYVYPHLASKSQAANYSFDYFPTQHTNCLDMARFPTLDIGPILYGHSRVI